MTDSTGWILGAASLALAVILYLWLALALAAVFRKIGEPTWKAWIPVLNVATVLKLGGFSPWLVLLNIVPIFGGIAFIVVFIVAVHRISVGFGAGAGMTVVGALFPVIWASILGFGSARWEGDDAAAPRSAVDEDSAPARRGRDFDGPYVPLIGGWTPDPADSAREQDAEGPAESVPAAVPGTAPVAVPFAAPSGSLSDAAPSPSDWAPPADLRPANFDGPRRASGFPPAADVPSTATSAADAQPASPAVEPAPVAPTRVAPTPPVPTSVFDVLDALRDEAPATGETSLPREPAAAPSARGEVRPGSRETDDDASRVRDDGFSPVSDRPLAGAPARGDAAPAWTPPATFPDAASAAGVDEDSDGSEAAPWANPPRRTPRPDADGATPASGTPLTRPAPEPVPAPRAAVSAVPDDFPELSEAVSAVSEAPDAGSPRSARTSVSALYTQPEVPSDQADDDFDELDRTVVTRRKRIPWALIPPGGTPVDLTSSVVILGRRPALDPSRPDAQLVPISDDTRTVSKTHARLELRGDTWFVTDLDSTNGVLFATLMGTEVEAPPGEEIEAGERFFLGDAEVRLSRRDV